MKKRKVTKAIVRIVAQRTNIPFEYLYTLYKQGWISKRRLFEMWNNALYRQGITKRYIRFRKKEPQHSKK